MKREKGFWNFLLLGTKELTNSIHISLNKELGCCTPSWAPAPQVFALFLGPLPLTMFLIFCTKGPYTGFFTTAFVLCPLQTFWGTPGQNGHSVPTPVQPTPALHPSGLSSSRLSSSTPHSVLQIPGPISSLLSFSGCFSCLFTPLSPC